MRLKWKVAIRRIDPETKKLWEPEFLSAFFKELFCLYRDSMKSLTIIHYTSKKKIEKILDVKKKNNDNLEKATKK